jgi:hypothetical protein
MHTVKTWFYVWFDVSCVFKAMQVFSLQSFYYLRTWCSYAIRHFITSAIDTSSLNNSIRYRIVCSVYVRLSWSVPVCRTDEPTGVVVLPLVTVISCANIVKYSMKVKQLNCTGDKCLPCKYFILNRACKGYRLAFLQFPSSLVISLHVTAVEGLGVYLINYFLFLVLYICEGMLSDCCSVCGSDGLTSLHLTAICDAT